MSFTISAVQTAKNKKGNAQRQRYAQSGQGRPGADFSAFLAHSAAPPVRHAQDGFAGSAQNAYDTAKENEIRNLWRHVQQVNRQITTLLAR